MRENSYICEGSPSQIQSASLNIEVQQSDKAHGLPGSTIRQLDCDSKRIFTSTTPLWKSFIGISGHDLSPTLTTVEPIIDPAGSSVKRED